jgi:cytochrome c-type protein NapC
VSEPSTASPPLEGFVKRLWKFLWSPNTRFSLAGLLIFGGITGVVLWGSFNWALELANTESFCITCHEMRDNPYAELQNTIHYKNGSGVRATCPDCHVPKQWIYKIIAKIEASIPVIAAPAG